MPCDRNSTIASLTTIALARAKKRLIDLPPDDKAELHLHKASGPLLDAEDTIHHVVTTPGTESIFLTFGSTNGSSLVREPNVRTIASQAPASNGLRLRVVTPDRAHDNKLNNIASLATGQTFTGSSSLKDIMNAVYQELAITAADAGQLTVDIYTSVRISTTNLEQTIDHTGLQDVSVGGVLNIFAIKRQPDTSVPIGHSGTFGLRPYWQVSPKQSDRGMASFLSSLRVFAHLIKSMSEIQQEAILQVLHSLFRFPPALAAFRKLIDGKTLSVPESASIVQVCRPILKEMVPLSVIKVNAGRLYEGSRLLFGYILYVAKQLKIKEDGDLPLREAYTTVALNIGSSSSTSLAEKQATRVKQLSADQDTEVSFFNPDILATLSMRDLELSNDLQYLATLCADLPVTPPAGLHNAQEPCLTLDEEGHQAVYLGRQACAGPGEDFLCFRPVRNSEAGIDVAAVTQKLQPHIDAHKREGTWVFDQSSSDSQRKIEQPDEIVVFCVDTSQSMSGASGFKELNPSEDQQDSAPARDSEEETKADSDNEADLLQTKAFLGNHESWNDMVAIVALSVGLCEEDMADQILEQLSILLSREIKDHYSEIASLSQRFSHIRFTKQAQSLGARISELEGIVKGLDVHRQVLIEHMCFQAKTAQSGGTLSSWQWYHGQEVPILKQALVDGAGIVSTDAIPDQILCPISQTLMEDPVRASDGHVYDRKNITRWFALASDKPASPFTGKFITDTALTVDIDLHQKVKAWTDGEDIVAAAMQDVRPVKRARSIPIPTPSSAPTATIEVSFATPKGFFTRKLPTAMSHDALYRIACRGMRGSFSPNEIDIRQNSSLLRPSLTTLGSINYSTHMNVVVQKKASDVTSLNNAGLRSNAALIKLFDQNHEFLFAYWVARDAPGTFASVLFRYWRFQEENERECDCEPSTLTIWTDNKNSGDSSWRGHRQDSWNSLSNSLTRQLATGCLDAGESLDASNAARSTDPLVLKLGLQRYESKKNMAQRLQKRRQALSRLDVCKQLFGAYINRCLAYNYANHLALITFSSEVNVRQQPNGILEDFRNSMNDIKADQDTALWKGLEASIKLVNDYGKQFPNARKRIFCLSDGADTKSGAALSHHDIMSRSRADGIVIDALAIGSEDKEKLYWVASMTGGYALEPKTLKEAVSAFELEPILSLRERPMTIAPPLGSSYFYGQRIKRTSLAPDSLPARRVHTNQDDKMVSVRSRVSGEAAGDRTVSSIFRGKRILQELSNIAANPHPNYDVYCSESKSGIFEVVIEGPRESMYQDGTFVLFLELPDNFPHRPPVARFVTPIYHANTNHHGLVCHAIVGRDWTTDTTIVRVLNSIFALLLVPEYNDPANLMVAQEQYTDQLAMYETIKDKIKKYATKNRAEWRKELTGGDGEGGDHVHNSGDVNMEE